MMSKIFTNKDFDFIFGLSSQGNYFWQNVFIRIDPGSYQMWLHDRKDGSRMLSAAPTSTGGTSDRPSRRMKGS